MPSTGRPSVYQDSYPEELIKRMALGQFDYEIYADWDICKDTFYRWLREKPDLKEAYDVGLAKCLKWWSTEGKNRFGERDDRGFKYWISIMNNKFGWGKDDARVANNTQINIQNVNLLQQKNDAELIDFIKSKLEQTNIIEIDYQDESTKHGEGEAS
jgi:hypothetical protein